MWALLRRRGRAVNPKRVHRLWRCAGLALPRRRVRRKVRTGARVRPLADRPNAVWTYDLIHDACTDGTPSKCLTVVDEFTALSPPQPSSHLTFDGRRAISMPVGNAPVTKANPAKAGSAKPRVLALLRDALSNTPRRTPRPPSYRTG